MPSSESLIKRKIYICIVLYCTVLEREWRLLPDLTMVATKIIEIQEEAITNY